MKLWLVVVGMLSMLAQVVLLREVTVAFFGSELVLVLGLGVWLLGTACGALIAGGMTPRHTAGSPPDDPTLRWLFIAVGVLLALAVLLARGAHRLWHGVPGADLPLHEQWLVLLGCLVPVSALTAFVFVRAARCATGAGFSVADAYALESAGALVGGMLSTLVAIAGMQNFAAAGATAALAAAAAAFPGRRQPAPAAGAAAAFAFGLATLALGPHLDRATARWNHPQLVTTRDTPYSRVTVTTLAGQITVFENDALSYESQTSAVEAFVHLAAAQRDTLRTVLVLGGYVTGLLPEILQHGPERVDAVELDATLLDQVTAHLPERVQRARRDPRVQLVVADPRRFSSQGAAYDLVLVGMPEPESGRTNRYYTQEFFALCAQRLHPAGVLALRLRGAENLWTPQTVRRLASVERALRHVFADVVVLPGETTLLLASRTPLDRDPELMAARLARRHIVSALVRPPFVRYLYANDRYAEIAALLQESSVAANSDRRPSCYQTTMLLSLARFFPRLARLELPAAELRTLARLPWAWVTAVAFCAGLVAWRRRPRRRAAAFAAITGGAGMLLEAVLLVDFQTRSAVLYQDLGWLITAFMCGITAGAAALPRAARVGRRDSTPSRLAGAGVASALCATACGTLAVVRAPAGPGVAGIAALLVLAGAGVGAGFAYATTRCRVATTAVLAPTYAGDVLGGCIASLAAALWFVPVLGLPATAGMAAVVTPLALLILL